MLFDAKPLPIFRAKAEVFGYPIALADYVVSSMDLKPCSPHGIQPFERSERIRLRVWLDGLTQHLGCPHGYEDVGESQRLIFLDETKI